MYEDGFSLIWVYIYKIILLMFRWNLNMLFTKQQKIISIVTWINISFAIEISIITIKIKKKNNLSCLKHNLYSSVVNNYAGCLVFCLAPKY